MLYLLRYNFFTARSNWTSSAETLSGLGFRSLCKLCNFIDKLAILKCPAFLGSNFSIGCVLTMCWLYFKQKATHDSFLHFICSRYVYASILNYLLDLVWLHDLHSICPFSNVVLPPCDQGTIWSPSICDNSKCCWQCGQTPFCFWYIFCLSFSLNARKFKYFSFPDNK